MASTVGGSGPPSAVPKSPLDYRNGDLVSRLLAATPPYLYNMPLAPHSFFFSEMLRSFVQAKTAPPTSRRGRKRSWRDTKPLDKPLELTTTPRSPPPKTSPLPLAPPIIPSLPLPPPDPLPQDLMPPAPLWFPPYPYTYDPLHFFIDLRVSGHIWNKESVADEPLNLQTEEKRFRPNKHCSAFSVPRPRQAEVGDPARANQQGTNYVMHNLGRIYEDVKRSEDSKGSEDAELSPEEKRCKDLRALIGLELVVDYVKHEDKPGEEPVDPEGGLVDLSVNN